MPSFEEQWLTESFAEYSAGLLLKTMQSEAVFKRLVNTWRARGAVSAKTASIPLANRVYTVNDYAHDRVNLLYNKGPYLLAVLHKQVGDEKFLTFLKSYQKSFHNKFGTTKDVEGLLGFITKQDFKPFFDQYYWGTAMPDMK
jgi:aminopeptidase N